MDLLRVYIIYAWLYQQYFVKSKKKKKRSLFMGSSGQDKDIATTTGVKAGVFRKLKKMFTILPSLTPSSQGNNQQNRNLLMHLNNPSLHFLIQLQQNCHEC